MPVVREIGPLVIFPTLLAPAEAQEEEGSVAVRAPLAESERVAPRSGRLVEQGSGGNPMGVVQSCRLQRYDDALDPVCLAHLELSRTSRDSSLGTRLPDAYLSNLGNRTHGITVMITELYRFPRP